MRSRAAVFGIWALVALSAAYWGLRLFSTPLPVPAQAPVVTLGAAPRGDLVRLLGPDPVVVAEDSATPEPMADARFSLLGVVSPRGSGATSVGVALIAVDGQPARAFRVGAPVDGSTVLQTVAHNRVTLGPRDGAATVALELAPPAPAATGTLPAAGGVMTGARSFAAPAPTGLPPPKFVSPQPAPQPVFQPAPQVYTAPQVMPQLPYAQAVADGDEAEGKEEATDPNPLR